MAENAKRENAWQHQNQLKQDAKNIIYNVGVMLANKENKTKQKDTERFLKMVAHLIKIKSSQSDAAEFRGISVGKSEWNQLASSHREPVYGRKESIQRSQAMAEVIKNAEKEYIKGRTMHKPEITTNYYNKEIESNIFFVVKIRAGVCREV